VVGTGLGGVTERHICDESRGQRGQPNTRTELAAIHPDPLEQHSEINLGYAALTGSTSRAPIGALRSRHRRFATLAGLVGLDRSSPWS
jgi:hypothetical protein